MISISFLLFSAKSWFQLFVGFSFFFFPFHYLLFRWQSNIWKKKKQIFFFVCFRFDVPFVFLLFFFFFILILSIFQFFESYYSTTHQSYFFLLFHHIFFFPIISNNLVQHHQHSFVCIYLLLHFGTSFVYFIVSFVYIFSCLIYFNQRIKLTPFRRISLFS